MSLFDVVGCQDIRSLLNIRRYRYCSPKVVILNMRCVDGSGNDSREGDENRLRERASRSRKCASRMRVASRNRYLNAFDPRCHRKQSQSRFEWIDWC